MKPLKPKKHNPPKKATGVVSATTTKEQYLTQNGISETGKLQMAGSVVTFHYILRI